MTAALDSATDAALAHAVAAVAARARALDEEATDVRADLAALGEAGLFGLGFDGTGLDRMVRVIEGVSAHSLAAGFSAWAHRMTLEYVHHAPTPLRDRHAQPLRRGVRAGVTAMAPAFKQVAGLGNVPLIAEPAGGGLRISGPIPWASNVFDGALIVTAARTTGGATYVVVVDVDAPGIGVRTPPRLMALGATASTSLDLRDVEVPDADVISTDLRAFVARVRPAFLLLQSAFCTGLGCAALSGAEASGDRTAAQFASEIAELARRREQLRERLYGFAADPTAPSVPELIRLRLAAATFAGAATRLESTLCGGAGYALSNAANRRFREAAFLPIQSPSEGHLRWELKRYE
ncbi:acyl-CoA dehydrogenase [Mycobacterium alsense]|uniref:Acyl-CoA dehydrogenase n=1 Tax=Mycobacterium alsense TaxID=324058 RepID=A0ABD6P0E9_9MYCO|nr:acyl-CoA dehydrogenase family protein [Mycobacterium alsense]OBG33891.1 acyl-CoA dehydrogenase [Mycobacterium alsense]